MMELGFYRVTRCEFKLWTLHLTPVEVALLSKIIGHRPVKKSIKGKINWPVSHTDSAPYKMINLVIHSACKKSLAKPATHPDTTNND